MEAEQRLSQKDLAFLDDQPVAIMILARKGVASECFP